ncbi:SMP-30/gluconolactonase/LRE family protein [Paracoccus sediminicola]|uniref:SMP-30/gluconolactonase/LRE family protein n=1 Tax=Paracoccus sediminicola TaxID=3017783 RepID=UPI0022F015EC|nr:SMP-30/gluconolactonase/LRE family protein [Paracoccus sediminicola]WBU56071.1 SMP-30/gluconolactonase/LRE family protein [Paracoccus sediminicola]
MAVYDDRVCTLGEGPLWHPERRQFFWFDILGQRLLSREEDNPLEWRFDRIASAAGWVDRDRLLVATETDLSVLDLRDGALSHVVDLEADRPDNRCNDGRADRQGGFWIGTMGRAGQKKQGSIYRYYRGELRKLYSGISTTNAMCFTADGGTAHFSDTSEGKVWRVALDKDGWPDGAPELYLDLSGQSLRPDGAMIDSEGAFCVACWGAAAVIRFDAAGHELNRIAVAGSQSSCPAFGGADMRDLLVTTATEKMSDPGPDEGLTYLVRADVPGLAEPQVLL